MQPREAVLVQVANDRRVAGAGGSAAGVFGMANR